MHQKINIDKKTALTVGVVLILVFSGCLFLYSIFTGVVYPLFLAKEEEKAPVSLDSDVSGVLKILSQSEDLTGNQSFARLNEEAFTAQVLNGSSIEGQATKLVEKLKEIGIDVLEIGNTKTSETSTVVRLKERALFLKDEVIEKIGTKSGSINIERLNESDPFDIRIVIGR